MHPSKARAHPPLELGVTGKYVEGVTGQYRALSGTAAARRRPSAATLAPNARMETQDENVHDRLDPRDASRRPSLGPVRERRAPRTDGRGAGKSHSRVQYRRGEIF